MSFSGMTGFARVDGALGAWTWSVEARSVNGRNLETRFRGPPGFDTLERLAREGAQARFQRGQITIGLQAKRVEGGAQVHVNQGVLARCVALANDLVASGQAQMPTADGLLALKGVLETQGEDDAPEARAPVEAAMAQTLVAVLDGLKLSRLQEGAALAPVLGGQLDKIESLVAQAESEALAQVTAIRDRFSRRLADLVGDTAAMRGPHRPGGGRHGREGRRARGVGPPARPHRRARALLAGPWRAGAAWTSCRRNSCARPTPCVRNRPCRP
jgi:uncharacterized protein (TIGR00255 family)